MQIDTYLNKEKDDAPTKEAQKRLEAAIMENRALKKNLHETETNIVLLRTDLNQMRTEYESKVTELHE